MQGKDISYYVLSGASWKTKRRVVLPSSPHRQMAHWSPALVKRREKIQIHVIMFLVLHKAWGVAIGMLLNIPIVNCRYIIMLFFFLLFPYQASTRKRSQHCRNWKNWKWKKCNRKQYSRETYFYNDCMGHVCSIVRMPVWSQIRRAKNWRAWHTWFS